jgi:hypothetical protein
MVKKIKQSRVQNISAFLDVVFLICPSIQGKPFLCPECGKSVRSFVAKEAKRQDKIGLYMKFVGNCLHTWCIKLFPISGGSFEGEIKCKNQTYMVVIANPDILKHELRNSEEVQMRCEQK